MTKTDILSALRAFAHQRPRLQFDNYGDYAAYRREIRGITRGLHHVRELLSAVSWREVTAADLILAADSAFSGRLTITDTPKGVQIDYCTGQYFQTEYRPAVAAVLARALWIYWRKNNPDFSGDQLRRLASREVSSAVFRNYFA
jgi:hypothetical protein